MLAGANASTRAKPKCQILGQSVPQTPFSAARLGRQAGAWRTRAALPWAKATGAQGARRRGCTVRLAVPAWPEDGRRFLPKSEGPPTHTTGGSPPCPAWARSRGAPTAWGPSPGPRCLCAHRLSVAPSPGLRWRTRTTQTPAILRKRRRNGPRPGRK